jgi:hypothetical protein
MSQLPLLHTDSVTDLFGDSLQHTQYATTTPHTQGIIS